MDATADQPGLRVSSLTVYPVKSCGGIGVDSAVVTPTGLQFDRTWMVVSDKQQGQAATSTGRGGRGRKKPAKHLFVTQRTDPKMSLVRAARWTPRS